MRILFLNAFFFLYSTAFGQIQQFDSCSITPTYYAFFEGLNSGDTIKPGSFVKSRKLISSEKSFKISTFAFLIDNCGNDFVYRKVNSNEFSEEDLGYITHIGKGGNISFECILSVKNGMVVSFKPLFFFIK
jgi:hypothetical protein